MTGHISENCRRNLIQMYAIWQTITIAMFQSHLQRKSWTMVWNRRYKKRRRKNLFNF